MTSKYWHCRMICKENYRDLLSLGDDFSSNDFFADMRINLSGGIEYSAPPHDFVFNPNDKSPISDFVYFGSDFLCNEAVFSHFSHLVGDHIKKVQIFISGKRYTLFRHYKKYDLIDIEHSRHMTLPSGVLYNFTHIKLRDILPDMPPIFGLSQPQTVASKQIVNDAFKNIYDENGFTGITFNEAYS